MKKVNKKNFPDNDAVCVLVSGGLDSSVLLCEMANKYGVVYPVYVKSNLLWEKAEIYWLRKFLSFLKKKSIKKLKIITTNVLDIYKEHWSVTGKNVPRETDNDYNVYIPGRNIMLLSKTAVFCRINNIHTIALALLNTNRFPDATKDFFRHIQYTLSKGLNFKFSIITPFSELSKLDVIRFGAHLPLEYTFSCIKPSGICHCGICSKCGERKRAFKELNIKDKTIYKN
jgi:7-cyano-7-deazaguanine synthase